MEDEKKLYEEALNKWGVDRQIDLCIQEMGALTRSLLELRWEPSIPSRPLRYLEVNQAIGNVEIMLAQLRTIFSAADIDRYKQIKLRDLRKKLNDK